MPKHHSIDYVEFPCRDPESSKRFFAEVFGWEFTDYGDDYTAFSQAGLDGGFYRADAASQAGAGATLVVFYSDSLEETQARIRAAGGRIVRDIFGFPGGRRFHFEEPSGNEFAVWTAA